MKKISIIVPCFNAEAYIDRCIGSLTKQTIGIDSLEIIIVNDGSTDSTFQCITEWNHRYPDSIVIINMEQNQGQGACKNTALSYVTAPYIGFTDSDDWCEPDMYEKMYHACTEYDCEIAICGFIRDDGSKTIVGNSGEGTLYIFDTAEKHSDNIAYHTMNSLTWNTLNRTDWVKRHNLQFVEGKKYDDSLWITQAHIFATRVCVLQDTLYHYYYNPDSITLRKGLRNHTDMFESVIFMYEFIAKLPEYHLYHDALDLNFIRYFYFEGLIMLANRTDDPPVALFEWMRDTINILIPDWHNNIYIKDRIKPYYKNIIDLLDKEMTQADFTYFLEIVKQGLL